MRILIIFLMFLFIGGLLIISNNNLALHKKENIIKFKDLYLDYLDKIYLNLQQLTGEVVRVAWVPEN